MKTINVESLAGRYAPSSDFVSNRSLAIQTDPLLILGLAAGVQIPTRRPGMNK